jgi:hypothetical protein
VFPWPHRSPISATLFLSFGLEEVFIEQFVGLLLKVASLQQVEGKVQRVGGRIFWSALNYMLDVGCMQSYRRISPYVLILIQKLKKIHF